MHGHRVTRAGEPLRLTRTEFNLLVLLAQSGWDVPAREDTSLPLCGRVLVDLGDEQSIEQSLSTFSGHLTNIVGILKKADKRSLVILDELGAGTSDRE